MKPLQLEFEYLPSAPGQLLLQLKEISVISALTCSARTRCVLAISISKSRNQLSKWVPLASSFLLTHSRPRSFTMGSLPCKFILLEFIQGTALDSLSLTGTQVRRAKSQLSKQDYALLLSEPYKLLYGD